MSRLVIVSNRVAKADAKGQAAGGLAVAVLAALRETRGLWFGWSGKTVPHTPGAAQIDDSGSPTYATVDLNRTDYRKYYA
ncbi:MAG: trehalose-6-phosphate synthase, partial [Alphaproteobacteria bacterium]|nr:trehalose-6-phosphate synthase [Alphaproteobacteria bacterium]